MAETPTQFGIVTACYPADLPLVKATCASIRYFMPDVPIAVIADGDVCVKELERVYNVSVLRTNPYRQTFAIPLSGNYFVKWVAFLDCPFETFLYLDSDAIVWGNVASRLELTAHQFMALSVPVSLPDVVLDQWWFNPKALRELDPAFDPSGLPLFCAGAFAARRSLFSRDEISDLLELYRSKREIFHFGDQGIFNYAVFRKEQAGQINVSSGPLQIAAPDVTTDEFLSRFSNSSISNRNVADPAVLHFCGVKPFIQYRSAKAEVFTSFRVRYYEDLGLSRRGAWRRVLREEADHLAARIRQKARRQMMRSGWLKRVVTY